MHENKDGSAEQNLTVDDLIASAVESVRQSVPRELRIMGVDPLDAIRSGQPPEMVAMAASILIRAYHRVVCDLLDSEELDRRVREEIMDVLQSGLLGPMLRGLECSCEECTQEREAEGEGEEWKERQQDTDTK